MGWHTKRGNGAAFFPLIAAFALTGCGDRDVVTAPVAQPAPNVIVKPQVSAIDFLEKHWSRPLAPQGSPPGKFSPLEASLAPADCGQCHVDQYKDWQTALHSQAMGPGLMGQLVNMAAESRDEHQQCLRCHAPLAEQADSLATALASNTHGPDKLHEQGLVCAACHRRSNETFGPPRQDGSRPDSTQRNALPHGGFEATAAFSDSRFCASCHQFEADGYALNGKLLENTYEEWKTSRHALEGRTCQTCHMPERRHVWRGIHDRDMVRSAIDFAPTQTLVTNGIAKATLTVRNVGAGHYFPTYVTPKVVIEIEQFDDTGRGMPKTREERIVQRQVPLDLDREIADTRLPPDGQLRIDYQKPLQATAKGLVFRMRVEPDEFYARFYRSILASSEAGRGASLIHEALISAESSGFVAFEERRVWGQ